MIKRRSGPAEGAGKKYSTVQWKEGDSTLTFFERDGVCRLKHGREEIGGRFEPSTNLPVALPVV
jgi:hypothetical protein